MRQDQKQPLIKKVYVNFLGLRFNAEGLPLWDLCALLVAVVLIAVVYLLIAKSIHPVLTSLHFLGVVGAGGSPPYRGIVS